MLNRQLHSFGSTLRSSKTGGQTGERGQRHPCRLGYLIFEDDQGDLWLFKSKNGYYAMRTVYAYAVTNLRRRW